MDRAIKPMLAALQRELPVGAYVYEPKWDGLRCLAFVEGGQVNLRSRHGKPLARYFPELVAALTALGRDLVLDGEIVVVSDRATRAPQVSAPLAWTELEAPPRLSPDGVLERLARDGDPFAGVLTLRQSPSATPSAS